MLPNLIDKLISRYNSLKNSTVLGVLFLLSLFLRFPFFFRDYIDRDESTFILVAQSLVEGNLPYTELWDLKPPITFLFFSIIIWVFGKSFIAIRLAGAVIIALSSYYTYRISSKISNKKIAFWVGMSCVILQSCFGSIQGVMSEHIGMFFLVPAIYIITIKKEWYWLGFSGVLMGISIMAKLNMAYTALFVGIYLIYYFIVLKKDAKSLVGTIAYGLGIIVVILITWLPYFAQNLGELWWKSVIIAPLDYANERTYSILKFITMPTFFLTTIFIFFSWKKKYLNLKNTKIQLLLIVMLGVLYAFLKGGKINSHYLIQLYPIILVLAGIVLANLSPKLKLKISKRYLLILLLIPSESYVEYYHIIKHKIERGSFYNGEGITVPQYIRDHNISAKNIVFFNYHIGYWLLDLKPPTKASLHPSNICRPELFPAYNNPRKTTMEELKYIMDNIKPNTLVVKKNKSIFDKKQLEANTYIDAYIKKHYKLSSAIDKAEIYTRLK